LDRSELRLSGDVLPPLVLETPLQGLARVEQVCDLHCVTTWSRRSLRWSGVRFADFFDRHVAPRIPPGRPVTSVVLRGQDGYRTTMILSDLLAPDVLLVDTLDGLPLSLEHGAPLRLVAPAHYGYKSVKHLSRLEFWQGSPNLRPAALAFMDHPRARVALEERARWLPGWLLRLVYRPLIKPTAAKFAKAIAEHRRSAGSPE
jgi:DMSO/TMAO reductase YedYZ molybdopterin-dependent catalytic subunit